MSAVPTYTTLVGRQGKEGAFASHHSSDRWDDKPKKKTRLRDSLSILSG